MRYRNTEHIARSMENGPPSSTQSHSHATTTQSTGWMTWITTRHAPIELEDVWGTKWWPDRQFTFLCSIAESNAAHSRGWGWKEPTEPQLKFRRKLAECMLKNNLDEHGASPTSLVRLRKRYRTSLAREHALITRKTFTGAWNSEKKTWSKVRSKYLKTQCATCKFECRTYCSCNKSITMCQSCWGEHKTACNLTF